MIHYSNMYCLKISRDDQLHAPFRTCAYAALPHCTWTIHGKHIFYSICQMENDKCIVHVVSLTQLTIDNTFIDDFPIRNHHL